MYVTSKIKEKLKNNGGIAKIKLLKGNRYFNVILKEDGVLVDNLDKEALLEWKVFEKTIELLENNGGTALKGDAMGFKLGEGKLPINSIEGYVAKEVYDKSIGESVFRRITPIVNILIWVGICENGRGKLILK
ncbi:hypothetical protein [Clostridioides sp. ES-S-0010-02]|uniref:hypothetical protein n=1 Tax=Clostridioides sp. ES-S-0010-02 TaxID=2770776 RepID=UPI001D105DE0|nr:hypothetical protein JJC01_01285 [Clostridioides sp. ES-S-0010-02]